MILKWFIFLLASAWLTYVSRASLLDPHSHGFYRFFAWECIVALFLLNIGDWFRDPFSLVQIISWILLISSAYLVIDAVYRLRRFGMQDNQRQDTPLLGFEKTTALVTVGIYRHIRHPLYSSLVFLSWGIFFKDLTWLAGGLAAAATVLLFITARKDEEASLHFFGSLYREYMRRTKMFIPFVF